MTVPKAPRKSAKPVDAASAVPQPVVTCPVDGTQAPIIQGVCFTCGSPIRAKVEPEAP